MIIQGYFATQPSSRRPQHNEDSYFVRTDLGLVGVFDGVGGGIAGEIASSLAKDYCLTRASDLETVTDVHAAVDVLRQMLAGAHRAVRERIQEQPNLTGMSTTGTLLYYVRDGIAVAHVGDSRVRQIFDGKIFSLTQDQSFIVDYARTSGFDAEKLRQIDQVISEHDLDKEEANLLQFRHIITAALGTDDPPYPEAKIFSNPPGAINLVYTDGIGNNLVEESPSGSNPYSALGFRSILELVTEHGCSQDCANLLVLEAALVAESNLVRAKADDMTVIVSALAS